MAFAPVQYLHQALVQLLIAVIALEAARRSQGLGRVQPLDQMPGGELEEHAAGHLAPAGADVLVAQQRHDLGHIEAMVEIRAPDMHAGGGQNVLGTVDMPGLLRAETHHCEVRGAATDIDHQHQLLLTQALLVVQCRRNRLQLKADFTQAGSARRSGQGILRLAVSLRVLVDKMHGTPQHHTLRQTAVQRPARLIGHALEKDRDDVLIADELLVHRGLFQQQAAAQQAFEGTHQTPFLTRQVLLHGIAAEMRAVLFGIEEQCRGHAGGSAFQRQQTGGLARQAIGGSRVGGSEIDAQSGRRESCDHERRRCTTPARKG
ncbi:hypothetical protein SDC9_126284 [bioreactor metagenome]|uniref:Uncharacterized protein n=1 Tax=bioreactor metagenome TaxID=1076179 RepID=A0A645CQQ0_9ZZZZ